MNPQDQFDALDVARIRRFVEDGQEEHLHLELKELGSPGLDKEDRKNLGKALSGFANSSGGLVVWGVVAKRLTRDAPDVAVDLAPLADPKVTIARLNELTGEGVSPTVPGVRHRLLGEKDNAFAATLVPASDLGPHMAKFGEDRYYKRSGDSFYRLEHFDLADMFGRRPKPALSLSIATARAGGGRSAGLVEWKGDAILRISNDGRGSATAPYLSVNISGSKISQVGLDGNGYEGLPRRRARGDYLHNVTFGGTSDHVIHPDTILDVGAIRLLVQSSGPGTELHVEPIKVEYQLAAEGMPPVRGVLEVDREAIIAAVGAGGPI